MMTNSVGDDATVRNEAKLGRIRHPMKAASLLYSAPRALLRGPIYGTFVVIIGLLAYSFFASLDVVVTAPLTLQRQSVSIQAINGGLVESVAVKENTTVTSGDNIITIQEKIRAAATPEQEAILKELRDLDERREAKTKDYEHRLRQLGLQLAELMQKRSTGKEALEDRVRQVELQLQAARRNRDGLADSLRSAQADLEVKQRLFNNRDIPAAEFQRADQRVKDLARSVGNADGQIENVRLSLDIARRERDHADDQHGQKRLESEIEAVERDRDRDMGLLDQRLAELESRRKEAQTLVPGVRYDGDRAQYATMVPGIVTAIPVQRGQIINPGETIATIVRETAPLEARVLVQNKDIGHLKHGQAVQIKYFAYPYQQYGIQSGVITNISARPSTVAKEDSLYVINVALEHESISEIIADKKVPPKQLEIGLLGNAEIKTGKKRFIEMLFAPASRFFRGGEDS